MAFGSFGLGGVSDAQGPYAAWVARLAAWSADPTTSLDGLPVLEDHTFDQATYHRFNDQLATALELFMQRWSARFSSAVANAGEPHALGVALVELRSSLRPRLELARHPGLPQAIRDALEAGLAKDLANLQQQIEDDVRRSTARGSVDHAATDRLLKIVRDNAMTSLLTTGTLGDLSWEPPPANSGPPAPPVPPTRRLFPTN